MATEAAALQGKYFQMKESLLRSEYYIDTNKILNMASDLKLDMDLFINDLSNDNLRNRIQQNIAWIKDAGYYGTPTVVINNKLLSSSISVKAITNEIETAINKKK